MAAKKSSIVSISKAAPLRLGFVPLTDCAPLVVALELGFFKKYGLHVSLSRELGWASIRDKIIHRELDAAHAVAGMPFAATFGLGSSKCDCATALVLNLQGNAVTLSNSLWRDGVRSAAGLRQAVIRARGLKTFTFGVVSLYSSHHFLLRSWLAASGIKPGRDVHIVVVPPPQMVANLQAGHLDGFCAGEPWNSVAVAQSAGWCVATSAELDPGHPEKVLMVRRDFAANRDDEHVALVAALLDACEFCQSPSNRDEIAELLSRSDYVGVPVDILRRGLNGDFNFGHGRVANMPDFTIFHGDSVNEPTGEKAAWVLERFRTSGLCQDPANFCFAVGRQVFRADIFDRAMRLRNQRESNRTESSLALAAVD